MITLKYNVKSALKSAISAIASPIAKALSKSRPVGEIDTILIILLKPLGIGDFVMLSPYIPSLVARYSSCNVYMVSDQSPFFDCTGLLWVTPSQLPNVIPERTMIISPDISFKSFQYLRFAKYRVGYFFCSQPYSNFLGVLPAVDIREDHYSVRITNLLEPLGITEDDYGYDSIRLKRADIGRFGLASEYVVISPISNWRARQYPIERFVEIAGKLSKKIQVVLVGSQAEAEVWGEVSDEILGDDRVGGDIINLMGATTLEELVGVFAEARLCIANDSGPAHIGTVSSDNTIVIYGCCGPEIRRPLISPISDRVTTMSNGDSCAHFPCFDGFGEPSCRNATPFSCLDTSQDLVLQSAFTFLDNG